MFRVLSLIDPKHDDDSDQLIDGQLLKTSCGCPLVVGLGSRGLSINWTANDDRFDSSGESDHLYVA